MTLLTRCATAALALTLTAAVAVSHPLDGLSATEIRLVTEILRTAGEAGDETRYPRIELLEPPKAEVLSWSVGDLQARRAVAHFRNGTGFRTAVVNITTGNVESAGPAAGQPMVLLEEFTSAMTAALEHPEMIDGLARRGLSPADVFCLPLTAGGYPTPEHAVTRLMKVPCYRNPTGSNYYASPIEGLFAVVDLIQGKATDVVDEGIVPLANDSWGYTAAEVEAREPLRPTDEAIGRPQPSRPGYSITASHMRWEPGEHGLTVFGERIEWDIWRFRLRVDKRPGIVLSNIDVRDGERWRSVLYQAHLSEVFVPYMDPSAGWYWRTYMDSGEYGFGSFLSPLRAGVDCPADAAFLAAVVHDDRGRPREILDAICVFERYIGDPAWRHFEGFAQSETSFVPAEGRPDTELVVRTASVVGNYDYLIDYRFRQSGEITIQIGATGIDGVKGVASRSMTDATAVADTAYGTLVAPNLVAPFHDHYFNFRLDFDVDGPINHPAVLEVVAGEPAPESPRRSFWKVERSAPASELEGRYRLSAIAPKYFLIANEAERTALGHHPAYMIHHGSVAYGRFEYATDPPMRRNAYIEHTI